MVVSAVWVGVGSEDGEVAVGEKRGDEDGDDGRGLESLVDASALITSAIPDSNSLAIISCLSIQP